MILTIVIQALYKNGDSSLNLNASPSKIKEILKHISKIFFIPLFTICRSRAHAIRCKKKINESLIAIYPSLVRAKV